MRTESTGRMAPPTERPWRTKRLEQPPFDLRTSVRMLVPSELAYALKDCHNAALRRFGSDCGSYHAFDPTRGSSAGVFDGSGGFPDGTVVSKLAWGRIDEFVAQRLLEMDGAA